MKTVTDHLIEMLTKFIHENHLVVWFDPEKIYTHIAESFSLPGVTVAKYNGSFIALRKEVSTLMQGENPPNLLMYVPLDENATDNALIAFTKAGVVLSPRPPWQRSTSLGTLVAQVLRERGWDEKKIEDYRRRIEKEHLSLTDIDEMLGEPEAPDTRVLALIFTSSEPHEIVLQFLTDSTKDAHILQKAAIGDLQKLLAVEFGVNIETSEPAPMRNSLLRHIFATVLFHELKGDIPEDLKGIPHATTSHGIEACLRLVHVWQDRSSLQDAFLNASEDVERAFGIEGRSFSFDQLRKITLFKSTEIALLGQIIQSLRDQPEPDLIALAGERRHGIWASRDPTLWQSWSFCKISGEFLLLAGNIRKELGNKRNLADLIQQYTSGTPPWAQCDQLYRKCERLADTLHQGISDAYGDLAAVQRKVQQEYMEVADILATLFSRALEQEKFVTPGILRQRDIFETIVRPSLESDKTAYILVDSLRYEMGCELTELLHRDGETVEITPAIGTLPSVTQIGMAALLPRAGTNETTLVETDSGIALKLNNTILKTKAERLAYLESHVDTSLQICNLEEFFALNKKQKERFTKANFLIITSQEIDEAGESDMLLRTRHYMDEIIRVLRNAMRLLSCLGIKNVIITTDHGHLFGNIVGSEMKVDPPGGKTVFLHRRVWVGQGGTTNAGCLRIKSKDIGLGEGLDIVTPRGIGVFKVPGGGRAYFHGGCSPQELIIPVISVHLTPTCPPEGSPIVWTLEVGGGRISSRMCSVKIDGKSTAISGLTPPKVRVEIRSEGQVISSIINAHEGYDESSREIQLKVNPKDNLAIEPNTVFLMISGIPTKPIVSIHLIDAQNGVELKKVEGVPISIMT